MHSRNFEAMMFCDHVCEVTAWYVLYTTWVYAMF